MQEAGDRHLADAAGNGGDVGGAAHGLLRRDVADDAALAVRGGDAVDADVDRRRHPPDPVATHHLRPADGGDQDVGIAADGRQVAGLRVGDRHRAVVGEEELRHRLADDVGAPDDDGVLAGEAAGAERRLRASGASRAACRARACARGRSARR